MKVIFGEFQITRCQRLHLPGTAWDPFLAKKEAQHHETSPWDLLKFERKPCFILVYFSAGLFPPNPWVTNKVNEDEAQFINWDYNVQEAYLHLFTIFFKYMLHYKVGNQQCLYIIMWEKLQTALLSRTSLWLYSLNSRTLQMLFWQEKAEHFHSYLQIMSARNEDGWRKQF